MATTHIINGVEMRENSVGTAIILSIITLGIYWFVLVYRNTADLHKATDKDSTMAMVLFVVGIFFPLFMIALFSLNGIALNELREQRGRSTDMTWIVALLLNVFLVFVGSIVWAVHYDNALQELSSSEPGNPDAVAFTHVA